MKTFVYLIMTCFISTGAFMAALNLKNPWPAFTVAFGVWFLFFRGCAKRSREAARQRELERSFQHFMLRNYRNRD